MILISLPANLPVFSSMVDSCICSVWANYFRANPWLVTPDSGDCKGIPPKMFLKSRFLKLYKHLPRFSLPEKLIEHLKHWGWKLSFLSEILVGAMLVSGRVCIDGSNSWYLRYKLQPFNRSGQQGQGCAVLP